MIGNTYVAGKVKALAIASVLGFLSMGSVTSFAAHNSGGGGGGGGTVGTVNAGGYNFRGINGIVAPSLPGFVETVKVDYKKSGSGRVLTATYNTGISQYLTPSNGNFTINNTSYALNAVFNNSNQFQSGSVVIKGTISGLGINTTQTLMTANLTKFATGFGGMVLGFNTSNIVCHPNVYAYVGCTTNEAVYIGLNKSFNFKTDFKANGVALTSVPIPAAAWLFGSGLLGLMGIARRKKKIAA